MVFRCLETCIQATWIREFTTKSRRQFLKSCGLKRNSTRALLLVPTQNVKTAKGTNQSRKIWHGEITSKVHVTICRCPDFIDVFQQLHDLQSCGQPWCFPTTSNASCPISFMHQNQLLMHLMFLVQISHTPCDLCILSDVAYPQVPATTCCNTASTAAGFCRGHLQTLCGCRTNWRRVLQISIHHRFRWEGSK